jgi:hypothetical protein
MADKISPCDISGICPYNSFSGMDCRNNCGIGVDEHVPETCGTDVQEIYSPYWFDYMEGFDE